MKTDIWTSKRMQVERWLTFKSSLRTRQSRISKTPWLVNLMEIIDWMVLVERPKQELSMTFIKKVNSKITSYMVSEEKLSIFRVTKEKFILGIGKTEIEMDLEYFWLKRWILRKAFGMETVIALTKLIKAETKLRNHSKCFTVNIL